MGSPSKRFIVIPAEDPEDGWQVVGTQAGLPLGDEYGVLYYLERKVAKRVAADGRLLYQVETCPCGWRGTAHDTEEAGECPQCGGQDGLHCTDEWVHIDGDADDETWEKTRRWMYDLLHEPREEHPDLWDCDGTVLLTPLAEAAAEELGLSLDDAEATIPPWVFELAHEVGENWDALNKACDDDTDDDPIITCGCGEKGRMSEMLDDSGLEETCGGTGYLNCFCGGDSCVCHYHGGIDCDGCEDCQEDEYDEEEG